MSMNEDIAVAKTRIDTDLQGIQVADISFDNGKCEESSCIAKISPAGNFGHTLYAMIHARIFMCNILTTFQISVAF